MQIQVKRFSRGLEQPRYSPRKTNSGVLEPMIFESKTGFSEGSISLDKVSEERQLLTGEGGSKSREFVLRGL